MSNILEFYSVSWEELKLVVGSRNRKLYQAVLEEFEPGFKEQFAPKAFGSGPDFAEGLRNWIEGSALEGGASRQVQLGEALGLIALVKHFGQFVGSLDHSGAAFEKFAGSFLMGVAQKLLPAPFSFDLLLERPILGSTGPDDFSWGGLSRSELRQLGPRLSQDAPAYEADLDFDEWLRQLWDSLGSALDLEKDLVTLYG
jgi:hypothetical protein